jgi:phosphinothricin acetyltransferase
LIRPCLPADAPRICEIYNYYVRETVVTFEEAPVEDDDMAGRIEEVAARFPFLVSERDGKVVGYAYAARWHARSAYRFSVESTIYLAPNAGGRGIGSVLYAALLAELRSLGVHCVIGGIALPNPSSVALHEKFGFRKVGQLDEIGWKFGNWVDVGYWQLVL